MAYETAKRLLERARTFSERADAVAAALADSMPLYEIERYLDWLDSVRAQQGERPGMDPPAANDLPGR